MTPTLISFCDIDNNLRYVNVNNIEVIKFADSRNLNIEKMCIRYRSGVVIECGISSAVATAIKKKLNSFVI